MDPQSVAFVPHTHSDSWRMHTDLLRLQQVQADHADRLLRLERRQDDDARMKSVWGGASPFPSVLSGTPQQGRSIGFARCCQSNPTLTCMLPAPLSHPSNEQFKDFDDESTNLIGSLQLDADDEPRRMGATSRANSVRFDESANQGHWSHASRSSLDFMPRSSSSLGGILMNERTSSHKSDGRASSVHSVRSAASGRASSLNLDTGYGLGDPSRSPLHTPGVAPGLLILGSVPAIIRCWMNTNFKHDALLYAAICSASYKSHIDLRLIQKLGFEHRLLEDASGATRIELPIYFPEAVPHPSSSRSSSPAPQVPSLSVEFNVMDHGNMADAPKSIQIILGSDVLRTHNADILFSSNNMTLYNDDQCKLSIPLVRPEDETTFNKLRTTGTDGTSTCTSAGETLKDMPVQNNPRLNGLGQNTEGASEFAKSSAMPSSPPRKYQPPEGVAAESTGRSSPLRSEDSNGLTETRERGEPRPSLSNSGSRADSKNEHREPDSTQPTSAHGSSSPAIWSNWRRDAPGQSNQSEWSGSNKKQENGGYQRRDTGIKVLKPLKTASRSVSGPVAPPSSVDNRSRFFDDGKRRGPQDISAGASASPVLAEERRTTRPSLSRKPSSTKENQHSIGTESEPVVKSRTNPIGGASAFAWLNSGGRT